MQLVARVNKADNESSSERGLEAESARRDGNELIGGGGGGMKRQV